MNKITLQDIQKWAALLALIIVVLVVISTLLAALFNAETVSNLLALTDLVLSWKVAAGGLVFGGGQTIVRAWKN